jgi:hypothetical protein
MIARLFSLLVLCPTLFGLAAYAEEKPSYEDLWRGAAQDPACKRQEHADFILFDCIEGQFTLWYFTKPNHAAHPGVIRRKGVLQTDGSWSMELRGFSFAADAGQPAFKSWLEQIADLDRQLREELAKTPPGQ